LPTSSDTILGRRARKRAHTSTGRAAPGTIRSERLWKRFRADLRNPFLIDRIEYVRDLIKGDTSRAYRWALRDVDFEIARGESVGLIGANGAGKSTLLKIIADVMYPTAGTMRVGGRVGALIEVRAGLHSDLTGRENIFLYGSLLGLKRKRVAEVFDAIVEFAQIESAVDRQVKFYSSGMQLRLGFAVAAYLEPDVLLVDEVLAVGDAAFQQRCLERMRQVLAQGTTLVFVSHDLATMEATCARGLWLRDGLLVHDGPIRETLAGYRSWVEEVAEVGFAGDGPVRLAETVVRGKGDDACHSHEPLVVEMTIESDAARTVTAFVGVSEGPATPIFVARGSARVRAGRTVIRCTIDHVPLAGGTFYLWASLHEPAAVSIDLVPWHPARRFEVIGAELEDTPRAVVRLSPVQVDQHWEFDAL
jgi:ABC-type polysaccharide/polyol phosphate transport system ATPase subunit